MYKISFIIGKEQQYFSNVVFSVFANFLAIVGGDIAVIIRVIRYTA